MKKNDKARRNARLTGLALNMLLLLPLTAGAQAPGYSWVNITGNSGAGERSGRVRTDAAGNVYTTGSYTGTVDFDPGPGVTNLTGAGGKTGFITKTNPDGKLVWAKMIAAGGTSFAVDAAGNSYVPGYFSAASIDVAPGTATHTLTLKGSTDAYLVKLDASGNFVWARQFVGTGDTKINAVAVDAFGNICFTGCYAGTTDFDPGTAVADLSSGGSSIYNTHIFTAKLDASGNYIWARSLDGSPASFSSSVAIATDASGNIFTTGYIHDTVDFDPGIATVNHISAGMADLFISRLDPAGNFVWARRMGGTEPDWAYDLAVDKAGNVYGCGTFDGKADFDPDGVGHIVTSVSMTGGGSPDIYLAKFSNNGDFKWVNTYGTTAAEKSWALAIGADDNICLSGEFSGAMNMDPHGTSGSAYLVAPHNNAFILNVDPAGSFNWVQQFRSAGSGMNVNSSISGIAVAASGSVYAAGAFRDSIDFDPSGLSDEIRVSTAGANDIFLHQLGFKSSSVAAYHPAFFSLAPNPAAHMVRIDFDKTQAGASVSVADMSGNIVLSKELTAASSCSLDVSDLSSGIYLLSVTTEEGCYTTKLTRQ